MTCHERRRGRLKKVVAEDIYTRCVFLFSFCTAVKSNIHGSTQCKSSWTRLAPSKVTVIEVESRKKKKLPYATATSNNNIDDKF